MSNDLKNNLANAQTWVRLLKILLFIALFGVAEAVIAAVVVVQFINKLISGESNLRLRALGQSLGGYCYQIITFLSFHSDQMPYPFAPWPAGTPCDLVAELPPPVAAGEPGEGAAKPRAPRRGRSSAGRSREPAAG